MNIVLFVEGCADKKLKEAVKCLEALSWRQFLLKCHLVEVYLE